MSIRKFAFENKNSTMMKIRINDAIKKHLDSGIFDVNELMLVQSYLTSVSMLKRIANKGLLIEQEVHNIKDGYDSEVQAEMMLLEKATNICKPLVDQWINSIGKLNDEEDTDNISIVISDNDSDSDSDISDDNDNFDLRSITIRGDEEEDEEEEEEELKLIVPRNNYTVYQDNIRITDFTDVYADIIEDIQIYVDFMCGRIGFEHLNEFQLAHGRLRRYRYNIIIHDDFISMEEKENKNVKFKIIDSDTESETDEDSHQSSFDMDELMIRKYDIFYKGLLLENRNNIPKDIMEHINTYVDFIYGCDNIKWLKDFLKAKNYLTLHNYSVEIKLDYDSEFSEEEDCNRMKDNDDDSEEEDCNKMKDNDDDSEEEDCNKMKDDDGFHDDIIEVEEGVDYIIKIFTDILGEGIKEIKDINSLPGDLQDDIYRYAYLSFNKQVSQSNLIEYIDLGHKFRSMQYIINIVDIRPYESLF